MFQNMKVDVIYYKTNTDFEMEFNLCGCCRMRLLTDKVADRKTAVYALARSVERSKIIILLGPLFGAEGVISTVAAAIDSKLVVVENEKFGIKTSSKIEIIDGSIPLVTTDGFFGGLIIERGNQTMVLLTESKSVRKTVMQELIHPYIADVCAEELKGDGETHHFVSDVTESEQDNNEELQPTPEKLEDISSKAVIDDIPTPDVLPEIIPSGAGIGVAKIADIAGEEATAVLSDITLDEAFEKKSAVEAIEESLTVAQNDFLAENDPDSALLTGDEDDSEDMLLGDGDYLLLEDENDYDVGSEGADVTLLGETEENTDAFNLGGVVELITDEDEDDSPIPMEITELMIDQEEHAELSLEDIDIPKGLVIDEDESQEEFYLPEVERELIQDTEQTDEDLQPLMQHKWVEGEAEDFLMDENVGEKKMAQINIPILVFSFILALIILVICYFMFVAPMRSSTAPSDFVREIYETLFG